MSLIPMGISEGVTKALTPNTTFTETKRRKKLVTEIRKEKKDEYNKLIQSITRRFNIN